MQRSNPNPSLHQNYPVGPPEYKPDATNLQSAVHKEKRIAPPGQTIHQEKRAVPPGQTIHHEKHPHAGAINHEKHNLGNMNDKHIDKKTEKELEKKESKEIKANSHEKKEELHRAEKEFDKHVVKSSDAPVLERGKAAGNVVIEGVKEKIEHGKKKFDEKRADKHRSEERRVGKEC